MSEPVSDLPLMDAAKVAHELGDVPVSTVLYLARQGRIPSIVIGRRVMFSPRVVQDEVRKLVAASLAGGDRSARTL